MNIHPELHILRAAFQERGRDIRLVGGAVRSHLLGEPVADIDLATDATPDEQETIYQAHDIHHIPTGVSHGTWTILLSDRTPVEITSLRHETAHDGRHATVTWSQNWHDDLARRDLTINAMAMAFDGTLIDPFNGLDDLQERRVRFVGEPEARIKEDYLRILRFFRFHARIAGTKPYDAATLAAIENCKMGLVGISRERVWSEMAKIISGPWGIKTLYDIIRAGLAPYIDLVYTPFQPKNRMQETTEFQQTRDPASLMASYLGTHIGVAAQARHWRWSNHDLQQATFIASTLFGQPYLSLAQAHLLATRGTPKYWLAETLRLLDNTAQADALLAATLPEFPIGGSDLIAIGFTPSPEIGQMLALLRAEWERSAYRLDADALIDLARQMRSS